MNTRAMLVAALAATLLTGTAYAQNAPQGGAGTANPPAARGQPQAGAQKATRADQTFLKEAMEIDLAEIQMGQLAQQKGQSQDVKQFGQTLQQDHNQNLQQAKQLAQQMDVTPPTAPNATQKQMHDRVSKLSGNRFDRQFARDMVMGHKEAIAKFEKESKSKSPLASFAQQTTPTLQKHLQMAESIQNAGAAVGSGNRNAK